MRHKHGEPAGGYGKALREARCRLRAAWNRVVAERQRTSEHDTDTIGAKMDLYWAECRMSEIAAGALYHGHAAIASKAATTWARSVVKPRPPLGVKE